MIPVGDSPGTRAEVSIDLETDRVFVLADHLYAWWRTAEEAEALAENLRLAAKELRRRRADAG
jgi:hypothetical protein